MLEEAASVDWLCLSDCFVTCGCAVVMVSVVGCVCWHRMPEKISFTEVIGPGKPGREVVTVSEVVCILVQLKLTRDLPRRMENGEFHECSIGVNILSQTVVPFHIAAIVHLCACPSRCLPSMPM